MTLEAVGYGVLVAVFLASSVHIIRLVLAHLSWSPK